MKVTVILVCWKRFEHFEQVIQSWLDQEEVDQVLIWDNSGSFKTKLPVLVVNSSQNLGPTAKFSLAQLAKNDLILYADDDVVAKAGFVKDLLPHLKANRIVGVQGRKFDSTSYYKSTMYRGNEVETPTEVDYLCGFIMLANKGHSLGINLKNCPNWFLIEDWWWERAVKAELIVVPTKKYELLPERNIDPLHQRPEIKELREEYYEKWVLPVYQKYFKPRYQRAVDDLLVGKKGLIGAEIGVFKGHHAREMFEKLDIEKLYLIDPYKKYESTLSPHLGVARAESTKVLREFQDRVVRIYKGSLEAAQDIPDGSLDFVYIDGKHTYEAVKQDIPAWYPKVKKGGIVGGHDYTVDYFPGTVRAVDEFIWEHKIKLNTKYGADDNKDILTNRDWWFIK